MARRFSESSISHGRRAVYRRTGFEALEDRRLLTAAPQLAALDDVDVAAGSPIQIALSATDADPGDVLTYTASIESISLTGGQLSTFIPQGNRSIRFTVADFGTMTFELFEQRVPDATAELISRIEDGVFDNQAIHRVGLLSNGDPFMFQGGGSETGSTFDDQFHKDLRHTAAGVLSMANRGADTNDAQIFVSGGNIDFLDHRYTIVGFLTEGDEVREAIQNVETELQWLGNRQEKSKPVEDITIESVEVFVDPTHGTMTVIAPQGISGEAEITVTVTDSEGNVDEETFTVSVVDPNAFYDPPPFLASIDDVHLEAGGHASFPIPGVDADGDLMYYTGSVVRGVGEIALTIDPLTGDAQIDAEPDAAGVYGVKITVQDLTDTGDPPNADTQYVPVFVRPPTPTGVALLASSDTGRDQGDGLTSVNNDGEPLKFRVVGTVAGAEVTVLADGVAIGRAVATGDNVVVTADGVTRLDDGPHTITAYQTLEDQQINVANSQGTVDLESGESAGLPIRIDTAAPQFTNQPAPGAAEGVQYVYDAQTDTETAGDEIEYRLTSSPAGMLVEGATGRVTWTPEAGEGSTRDVVLVAEDAAGNATGVPFTLEINLAPVFDPIPDQQVDELALLTFTAAASDDGGDVIYRLGDGAPEGAEIGPQTGVFTWTPTEAQGPGECQITVEAVDGTGLVGRETLSVWVDEVNVPPQFPNEALDWMIDEGELWQWQPEVQDSDLPANDLTFALSGDVPDELIFDPETGEIAWRPDEWSGGGTFEMKLRVDDGGGQPDEQTLTLEVREIDQPPTIAAAPQSVLPGGAVSMAVEAADPDVPSNGVKFTLEGDVPEGMTINETTGEVTWQVPAEFEPGRVTVTVRATEQTPAGDGLSGTADAVIQVVDPRVLVLEAALGQGDVGIGDFAGPQPRSAADPLLAAMPSESRGGGPAAEGVRSSIPSLTLEDTGLFGTQIGPFTPAGQTGQPLVPPEQPPERDAESGEADGTESPQRRVEQLAASVAAAASEAVDAVLADADEW